MHKQPDQENEQMVAAAFNGQAPLFDELYSSNPIIQYKRERVRNLLLRRLEPTSNILEINAGTGEDAIFLARAGHHVHATDISAGMQSRLAVKVVLHDLESAVSNEICSYTKLSVLQNKGPYDCIFSNFAGLNCTDELPVVLASFDRLLKPKGLVVLVMLPKFCLWETLLILKGKFKTATRRFFSSKGRRAKIEGAFFSCWYYPPSFIKKKLGGKFGLMDMEGLCTIVPPSYMKGFAEKHPRTYAYLKKKEIKYRDKWPWKYIGDYYIISFRKEG